MTMKETSVALVTRIQVDDVRGLCAVPRLVPSQDRVRPLDVFVDFRITLVPYSGFSVEEYLDKADECKSSLLIICLVSNGFRQVICVVVLTLYL